MKYINIVEAQYINTEWQYATIRCPECGRAMGKIKILVHTGNGVAHGVCGVFAAKKCRNCPGHWRQN